MSHVCPHGLIHEQCHYCHEARPDVRTDCRHDVIYTYRDEDPHMWACASCRRRFYPACPVCVTIGHRDERHPEPQAGKPVEETP